LSLLNCPRCGKAYPVVPGARELCNSCIQREDEDYQIVFRYLTTKPSATAQEISDATQVDIKEILRFLRENRLRIVKVDSDLHCESCGNPIFFGKYCENCQKRLKEDIRRDLDKNRILNPVRNNDKDNYSIQRDNKSGKISRRKTSR
jgi:flagellar operon protein (TIGR03826 family)